MSRPLWTGDLVVGAVRIPVQLLGAGDAPTIAFHHAHRCTPTRLTRVQQKRWCGTCRREVAHQDVVRIYEETGGQYIEITDQEMARCDTAASEVLRIIGIADAPRVSMLHIDTTAALVPASETAAEPLATFCAALGAQRIAIATLVFQKRDQIIWLGVAGSCCVVYLLRTADHVAMLLRQQGPTVGTRHDHVTQLRQILDRLPARVDHARATDDYQDRLRAMVARKTARDTRDQLTRALRPRRRTRR